jgi:hypothetical protein
MEIHVDEEACTDAAIDRDRVQKTIEEFNLNCARLANARLALHKGLEKAVKQLRESGENPQVGFVRLTEIYLSQDYNGGYWPQFFTLIRWRLSRFAEEYLRSINYKG